MPTHPYEDVTPLGLAEMFAEIGRSITSAAATSDALSALTATAAEVIPGARWVSISRGSGNHFRTIAANDEVARAADRLQYDLGTGPCVDAVIQDSVFRSADLAQESRWDGFGPRAAAEFGTRTVLSMRLTDQTDEQLNLGINIYGDTVGALAGDASLVLATLFAAHTEPAVKAVLYREEAHHLREALESNREIGVAMGVLMATHKLSRGQSFDLLRSGSQNSNRKLKDVATEVADTGVLDLPPAHAGRRPHRADGDAHTGPDVTSEGVS